MIFVRIPVPWDEQHHFLHHFFGENVFWVAFSMRIQQPANPTREPHFEFGDANQNSHHLQPGVDVSHQ